MGSKAGVFVSGSGAQISVLESLGVSEKSLSF